MRRLAGLFVASLVALSGAACGGEAPEAFARDGGSAAPDVGPPGTGHPEDAAEASGAPRPQEAARDTAQASGTPHPQDAARDTAVFAGGCFWCMEPPYDELEGVISTTSGYAGGDVPDPTYEQVSAGGTGHREVVRVIWNPETVDYERLLDVYWRNVDPVDPGGQFCDRGFQYTSAIYARDSAQARRARSSKAEVAARFEAPVATEVVEETVPFYPAEAYHQDYYEKNPVRYRFYKWRCGREDRLEEVWGRTSS